jgi:hypothetical protein
MNRLFSMLSMKQIHLILILSYLLVGLSHQAVSGAQATDQNFIRGGSTFQSNPFRSINRAQKKNPQFETPLSQGRVLAEAATSYDQ